MVDVPIDNSDLRKGSRAAIRITLNQLARGLLVCCLMKVVMKIRISLNGN
jgi:hypothetical protein